jgi:hypothetical protein
MNATILSGKVLPEKGCSKVHRCIDTGLGIIEILVLNKRVYFEAIGLLNAFENIIRISGKGDKVFRDPIASPRFLPVRSELPNATLVQAFQSFRSCVLDISLLRFGILS